MFSEFQKIAFKHFGIDQIIDQVINKLGKLDKVYLTGDLARGLDTSIIDIVLIGENVDTAYLSKLVAKAENLLKKKIRTLVYKPVEDFEINKPRLLIFGEEIND